MDEPPQPKPFIVQKRSNHGTNNPIVARLSVQTHELLGFANLTEEAKGSVFRLYHEDLQRNLLRCYDAVTRLQEARDATLAEVAAAVDQGARSVPFVIGLEDEVNTFLYEAKLYLRNALKVLNVFFGTSFLDASRLTKWKDKGKDKDGTVIIWAADTFGPDADFTRMLRSEEPWVSDIIKFRNAVEHLDSAGAMVLENYRATSCGILEPTWRREGKDTRAETPLFPDLMVLLDNLLTFGEDLLVCSIRQRPMSPHIDFALIPPEQRAPECAVRIRPVMRGLPPLSGAS
ncbi:hypothetical protein [Bradyrhizobium sp. AUGA SZCCT0283]|uniref:hypothetical protein n=1 Tax=Bradyrhizobium sp. AUGA SZCCT0283 TaxID=2807671 RepID=UPI001BADABC3|nr:hypothetical protein [Bradyrhizobium sp. AUGA SZCCT0283]MBR1280326.1 hypothetical protein [Bradyrhizobium sp. AUGA SZCCT0283]